MYSCLFLYLLLIQVIVREINEGVRTYQCIGGKRCLYNKLCMATKRKFSKSTVRYTVNGDAAFNPVFISFELLLAGDVELNPGDAAEETTQLKLPSKGLRIGHWNIERLTDFLLNTNKNVDILFLLETFLKPTKSDSVFNIAGYKMFRKDRSGWKPGGGLIAYVADNVKASRLWDLEDDCVESIWLSVHPHNSNRPILVGALYRPPSTNVEIDSKIEYNIETACLRNREMILVGDVNVNYLDKKTYSKHRLIKSLISMNMTQHVTVATRPKSNTCLDHVYTTHGNFISDIIVPNIGIADHLPVFFCRKYMKIKKEFRHKTINYLDLKNLNLEALLEDLRNSPWDSAFVFDEIDDIYDTLDLILNEALNSHIPSKQKRVKNIKQPAWINDVIVSAINKRDNELKKARKSNLQDDWLKYKGTKCFVTNLIKKSKRMYVQESIDENKGNPKGIWKALKSLTKSQKSNRITELKRDDNTVETDAIAMSNMLNDFFVNFFQQSNVTAAQTNKFDTTKIEEYVSSKIGNLITQFNIPVITVEETKKQIDKLSPSKATGPDGISVKVLKPISPVFAEPLTRLFNLSITKGVFPNKWKTARVSPLFKDGSHDNRCNYRPISVLPVFSKLLEKHVARSFMDYLVKNGLLYDLQSAFREGHSTESALIKLTDQILFDLDQDKVTGVISVDFQKAFDLVDHQLLLTKLRLYRLGDSTLSWFQSYITDRHQFVTIHGERSDSLQIKQGVPQGSVLGPILFLLFVNDTSSSVKFKCRYLCR